MTLGADVKGHSVTMSRAQGAAPRLGRARATSVAELSHIGLELFLRNGFEATTVEDIARAAGIGRRTFFRYFPSKNDLPWGDFAGLLTRMRDHLAATPAGIPLFEALRAAVLEFNAFPVEEVPYHRQRMTLLLSVPSLVAHSTLRYAEWRAVVAEFVAGRLGVAADDLHPQTVAWTLLSATLAGYDEWLRHDDLSLLPVLDAALRLLRHSVLQVDA